MKKIISLVTVMCFLLTICSLTYANNFLVPMADPGDIINGYVYSVEILDRYDNSPKKVADYGDIIVMKGTYAKMFHGYSNIGTQPIATVMDDVELVIDDYQKEGAITWDSEETYLGDEWKITGKVFYIREDITENRNLIYEFDVFWSGKDHNGKELKTKVAEKITIPLKNPNQSIDERFYPNEDLEIIGNKHISFTLFNDDNWIDESTFKYAFDKKVETEMKSFDVHKGIDLYPNFDGEYKLRIYAKANTGQDINKVYTVNVTGAPKNPPVVKMFNNKIISVYGGYLMTDEFGLIKETYGYFSMGMIMEDIEPTIHGIDAKSIAYVDNSMLLTEAGEVYVTGDNTHGEIGLGEGVKSSGVLTKLGGIPIIKEIADSGFHSILLTEDGEVYVTGNNKYGQLGLGDNVNRYIPTKIEDLPTIKAIDVGGFHSVLLTEDGEVYVMGYNTNGELGLGDNINRNTPTKIEGLPTIKAIASKDHYTFLLSEDGEVYSTGKNADGYLGLGDYEDRNKPTKLDIMGIDKIYASYLNYLVSNTGEVYVIGAYEHIGIGIADVYETNVPLKIEGVSGVESIVVTSVTFALTKNGEIYALWGYEPSGGVIYTPKKHGNISCSSYPKTQGLMIKDEAIDEIEYARYAFVSQTTLDENGDKVPGYMWESFNPRLPVVNLAPTSNGEYYLYVKLIYGDGVYRNNETHEVKLGPFEVSDIHTQSTSMDSYSYIAGDIHVMDRMSAEFNLSFVPSQDMTLGNTDVTFSNCFTADKLNIELLDKNGNILNTSNKWVARVYKNGARVSDITPNYVFKKRDEGSEKDNVYQFRILIGNDVINRKQSKEYQIRFNELKGISVDGTNQVVSANALPSTMMVYVMELMDVT